MLYGKKIVPSTNLFKAVLILRSKDRLVAHVKWVDGTIREMGFITLKRIWTTYATIANARVKHAKQEKPNTSVLPKAYI